MSRVQINSSKAKNGLADKAISSVATSKSDLTQNNSLLDLQKGYGNHYVKNLLNSGAIQAKLKINSPGDKYEREADRVADLILNSNYKSDYNLSPVESSVQRKCTDSETGGHQCSDCTEEEEQGSSVIELDGPRIKEVNAPPPLQRQSDITEDTEENEDEEQEQLVQLKTKSFDNPGSINGPDLNFGPGRKMPGQLRSYFEPRFGHDFSNVNIHTDRSANESAGNINARAFTTGNRIVFGPGEFSPGTDRGRKLIAHELTHVVQQNTNIKNNLVQRQQPTVGPAQEDWDFTPQDYGQLLQQGGQLRFESDSNWLPEPIRENILSSLNYLLAPSRAGQGTAGINRNDFFHGHVVLRRDAFRGPQGEDLRELYNLWREDYSEAKQQLRGSIPHPTSGDRLSLPSLVNIGERLNSRAQDFLRAVLSVFSSDVNLVYHTFEDPRYGPRMLPGDRRRNWISSPGANPPRNFNPPSMVNASSIYDRDFIHVFQFNFLIDQNGIIHVRPASIISFATITGNVSDISN